MIVLKQKNLQIDINPDKGAALCNFTYLGKNVLRPTSENASTPEEQSLFLMIPYCSLIKGGHFNYFGITRHIHTDKSIKTDPIHGDGWKASWQTEKQTENKAILSYQHTKEQGFPFDYKATVIYELIDNSLKITISIYNPSELPMPCGIGVHPYFIYSPNIKVSFVSSHIWYHKNDPIFDRPYPTPSQWDFTKPGTISEDFDTAFGGWDGKASIYYPDQQMKVDITAEDIFHHLILYHPSGCDFFCLEPVSNTPDAFNLAAYGVIGTGIQSVGAKQTLTKTITFTCQQL